MSWKELFLYICVLVTVVTCVGMGVVVFVRGYDKQVAVAKEIEVERVRLEQKAKVESLKIEHEAKLEVEKIQQLEATKRTKERMGWVPWYRSSK